MHGPFSVGAWSVQYCVCVCTGACVCVCVHVVVCVCVTIPVVTEALRCVCGCTMLCAACTHDWSLIVSLLSVPICRGDH